MYTTIVQEMQNLAVKLNNKTNSARATLNSLIYNIESGELSDIHQIILCLKEIDEKLNKIVD